jgi:putative transposase
MRSDRHYWATLNYVYHNPVRHGYVAHWTDWQWTCAREHLAETSVERRSVSGRRIRYATNGKDCDEPGT